MTIFTAEMYELTLEEAVRVNDNVNVLVYDILSERFKVLYGGRSVERYVERREHKDLLRFVVFNDEDLPE